MKVDKPKLILTLIVLFYTAICSLYIHSYLTGDNPPIFMLYSMKIKNRLAPKVWGTFGGWR